MVWRNRITTRLKAGKTEAISNLLKLKNKVELLGKLYY